MNENGPTQNQKDESALKRTALWDLHRELGARMVPFAGYDMPVQYEGLINEHTCVRTGVGLFDVSHMGEFRISGRGAPESLSKVVTGDVCSMPTGSALYTAICRPDGGMIDDIIVYRVSKDAYFICVNAANVAKDANWFLEHLEGLGRSVMFEDVSSFYAQIAIQGPLSARLMGRVLDTSIAKLPYYTFLEAKVLGVPAIVARTGYTGELGYEIYFDATKAASIWSGLLENGSDLGVKPCGLGARDTLRLEVGFGLYGQDMDEQHSPLESGLSWTLPQGKSEFIGADAIEKQKKSDSYQRLVGFSAKGGPVARQGHAIYSSESGGELIGHVTSGSPSPTLGSRIGFCRVDRDYAKSGSQVWVEIRNQRVPVQTCARVFYREGTAKADPSQLS